MAYEEKGWSLPANSNCRVSKPGSNLITNDIHERDGRTENETDDLLSEGSNIYNSSGGSYIICLHLLYILQLI